MTQRRKFIKQMTASGVTGMIAPNLFLAEKLKAIKSVNENQNEGGRLLIGWATADITPDKPVALVGQLHKRISEKIQDRLTATVLALETIDESGTKEQAIMVSCDVTFIRRQTQQKLQGVIAGTLDDFEPTKLFLNATHTHTAPGFIDGEFYGLYDTSDEPEVMKPSEYEVFFIDKVAEAVQSAWTSRKPGGFSWGLANAITGHNRRVVKTNGTAKMYGVKDSDFDHYEGINDNRVQMLFFWDSNKNLTGILLNTTATAQVTDSTNFVSADFYDEVRKAIREKYGNFIYTFIQIGAAGDITPVVHEGIYKQAETIMTQRKGITARKELANRLVKAVDEVFPYVQDDIAEQVVFKHTVAKFDIPVRTPPSLPFYFTDSVEPAEIHVIRLQDMAIATNPFELFVDYGLLIKTKSRALLTFIVQLSCHHSGYLPTKRAVEGGGYSADKFLVGHEGGYVLVEETVKEINNLWKEPW
ncbi:MAG TPA: hypothetical protein VFD91_04130 [Mariniphaga sp.]|nr:hypothetical protein [Mariniphaga sp.]